MTALTAPPDDVRMDTLWQEFEHFASFSQVFVQVFVVLTVGATLIAMLVLLANSPGLVIYVLLGMGAVPCLCPPTSLSVSGRRSFETPPCPQSGGGCRHRKGYSEGCCAGT
jgi:hypothetical protein